MEFDVVEAAKVCGLKVNIVRCILPPPPIIAAVELALSDVLYLLAIGLRSC